MATTHHAPHDNPRVAELAAITDPIERAAACQRFILNGRETLRQVEALRDQAIRDARTHTALTIDKLATRMRLNRSMVVEALRPTRKPDS